MKINKKGTNVVWTPEIEEYLEKRLTGLSKLLDANNPTLQLDIELARTTKHHQSGDIFMAEINLHIDGQIFRAVSEREDLFAAIDDMKDEIQRELRSYKGKKLSLVKKGRQKIKNLLKGLYQK
jgi:ribosomal subunit interface protein